MTATTYCPACNAVDAETKSARHPAIGAWVHAGCATAMLSEVFASRFVQVRAMADKQARKVASTLGVKVTRDGKYVERVEAAGRAARANASDSRWLAAVALATGAEVAAASAADAPALNEEELALVVGQAVAAALGDADKRIADIARAAVASVQRVEVVVKVADRVPVVVGATVHKQFERLLKMVAAGCNVWVAGPAGSGKTTAAEQVAKALGLPFRFNGAIDTEYKLSGFVDAQGRIVSTAFREAYTNGGVYLFDEVDASLPGALLAFNGALAGDSCEFPGVTDPVRKHPDFRCIAAGNTWGYGATSEYVGRNRLDAAFLDRFVQLTWDYDEALELKLATNEAWCRRVQALRAKARSRGLKVVISPRATIYGCKLLAAGFTLDDAIDATVRAKISKADWDNLSA